MTANRPCTISEHHQNNNTAQLYMQMHVQLCSIVPLLQYIDEAISRNNVA